MNPNLFILGFAKCGTTSTAYALSKSESVCLPKDLNPPWHFLPKEPELMQVDEDLRLEWCSKLYNDSRYRLDATPKQIMSDKVIKRVAAIDGRKIIVLMRHPVARALSWWNHYSTVKAANPDTKWGMEDDVEFHEMIDLKIGEEESRIFPTDTLIKTGEFSKRIKVLLTHASREDIHFAFLEDMIEDSNRFYTDICGFLDIELPDESLNVYVNSRKSIFEPTEKEISKLQDYYSEGMDEVEQIVGRVPPSWKNGDWGYSIIRDHAFAPI